MLRGRERERERREANWDCVLQSISRWVTEENLIQNRNWSTIRQKERADHTKTHTHTERDSEEGVGDLTLVHIVLFLESPGRDNLSNLQCGTDTKAALTSTLLGPDLQTCFVQTKIIIEKYAFQYALNRQTNICQKPKAVVEALLVAFASYDSTSDDKMFEQWGRSFRPIDVKAILLLKFLMLVVIP